MWHYLRDPTFSRFDTILECDRQTDRHTTTAYTALSIASRGKKDELLYLSKFMMVNAAILKIVKRVIAATVSPILVKFGTAVHIMPPNLTVDQIFKNLKI